MKLRNLPRRAAQRGLRALGITRNPLEATRALDGFEPAPAPPPESPRPNDGIYVSGRRDDYNTDRYARANLTPEKVGTMLRKAEEGDTSQQYELWEKVEQDPRVGRLYLRRRQAVLSNPLRIEPQDREDPKAVQAADLCRAAIQGGIYKGSALPGIKNLDGGLFDLTDAIGKAFAVAQIEWVTQGGVVLPHRLHHWPQWQFQLGDPTKWAAQDADDIRVLSDTDWNGKRLADFVAGTWIAHTQKTFSQPLARAAMFRSVTWHYLFKTYGVKDWATLLARYGIPPRIGKYDDTVDEKAQAALWNALLRMGKDHAAMIPMDSTIELIEQHGTGGVAPHPAMIRYCNEEIAVAIAGNTMAVDQGDRGARSAKEAFQDEDYIQAKFDANGAGHGGGGLAGTLQEQLCSPLVRYNLGEEWPLPRVFFDLDELEDLSAQVEIDKTTQAMGYPISAQYIAEKYYGGKLPGGVDPTTILKPLSGRGQG